MAARLEELEARLGHVFSNRELLLRALTHKSLLAEVAAGDAPVADNERLEFLGDAILGFLASDYLLNACPDYPEGKLSRLKAHLVSSVHLHEVALELGIGDYLQLGKGEELSGGRGKKALLANAVEALIAALYIDAGLDACREFLRRYAWGSVRLEEIGGVTVPVDAKSALQEFAQARKLPVPRYHVIRETGPEHAKLFTVEARIGKEYAAQADGASKKYAGQKAAEQLLAHLASLEPESEAEPE
jgi:ribonuclease III